MTNEREHALLGADTIQTFLNQFGDPSDPKVGLLLEVLLNELLHAKVVSILGKPQQTGHQIDHGSPRGDHGHVTLDGTQAVKPAPDMGNSDTQDNR